MSFCWEMNIIQIKFVDDTTPVGGPHRLFLTRSHGRINLVAMLCSPAPFPTTPGSPLGTWSIIRLPPTESAEWTILLNSELLNHLWHVWFLEKHCLGHLFVASLFFCPSDISSTARVPWQGKNRGEICHCLRAATSVFNPLHDLLIQEDKVCRWTTASKMKREWTSRVCLSTDNTM